MGGNMLDAVYDFVFIIAENNVAVLSHNFHNELFAAKISQIVQMFNFKIDNAFHMRLRNADDFSICNVLAKQHAEIRRRQGTGLVGFCQINQRKGSVG